MRHPLPLTAACAALASLLTACGQTGPLYLPDEGITTPVEIRPAPAQPPQPAPAEPAAAGPAAQEPAATGRSTPKKDGGEDAASTTPGAGT